MRVTSYFVDPEFSGLEQELQQVGVKLNVASASEHVANIERKTRVLKERVRSRWSKMPYDRIPKVMVSKLVKDVVAWLNLFPSKGCVVSTMGPRTVMTGRVFDYQTHCRVEFGQFCQAHDDHKAKNRVDLERTTDAIALRSSGNLQGGYRFMSLKTGKVLRRQHFTEIPITQEVINRVHALAARENQPDGIEVLDGHNVLIEDILEGDDDGQDEELIAEVEDHYEVGEFFRRKQ